MCVYKIDSINLYRTSNTGESNSQLNGSSYVEELQAPESIVLVWRPAPFWLDVVSPDSSRNLHKLRRGGSALIACPANIRCSTDCAVVYYVLALANGGVWSAEPTNATEVSDRRIRSAWCRGIKSQHHAELCLSSDCDERISIWCVRDTSIAFCEVENSDTQRHASVVHADGRHERVACRDFLDLS